VREKGDTQFCRGSQAFQKRKGRSRGNQTSARKKLWAGKKGLWNAKIKHEKELDIAQRGDPSMKKQIAKKRRKGKRFPGKIYRREGID